MRKRSLDDKKRHIALRMLTLEWLVLERRERAPAQNNKEVKPEQLKLSKTDPSI
jgi:hypothetical protein